MKSRTKRNCNEAEDVTTEKKLYYKDEHPSALEFTKVTEEALGFKALLENENLEEADGRKGGITYLLTTLFYAAVIACCLGVSSASKEATEFLHREAIANLRYLTEDDMVEIWRNYGTINDAFGKADRKILAKFENASQKCFRKLIHSGRYGGKTKWGYHVVLDATDIAFFTERHCDHCLTATFKKGTKEETTYYFHKILVARVYLAPGLSVVIGAEPIANDIPNPTKQDCENKAAVKLLDRIKDAFPKTPFLISGDALYANKTFMRKCIYYHWNYLFTLKQGAQPTLCDEYDQLRNLGCLDSGTISYDEEVGNVSWSNGMEVLLDSELPMNVLQYKTVKTVKKGKIKRAVSKEFTQKEYRMNMPELSKDHEKYDLDERKDQLESKRKARAVKKVQQVDEQSDAAKKALEKVDAKGAAALHDADVIIKTQASDKLGEGDVLEVTFMYITNIEITEKNICDLLLLGRSRWDIEEDFLRQKKGKLSLEHLRTLNENGMYIYFWAEQFADLMMQLYLYHTEVLKYATTQDEVYEWLKDSFYHTYLGQSAYLTMRTCLKDRNTGRKVHEAHLISLTRGAHAGKANTVPERTISPAKSSKKNQKTTFELSEIDKKAKASEMKFDPSVTNSKDEKKTTASDVQAAVSTGEDSKVAAASAEETASADEHDEEAAPKDEGGTHETVMVEECIQEDGENNSHDLSSVTEVGGTSDSSEEQTTGMAKEGSKSVAMFANEDANAGESVGDGQAHEPVIAEEPAQEDDRCDAHDFDSGMGPEGEGTTVPSEEQTAGTTKEESESARIYATGDSLANEGAGKGESVGNVHAHESVTTEEPAQEDDRCNAHDFSSVMGPKGEGTTDPSEEQIEGITEGRSKSASIYADGDSHASEDASEGESVGNVHAHEPVAAEESAQEDDSHDAHDLGSVTMVGVNGTQMVADGGTFVKEDSTQKTVADEESDFGAVECNEQNLDSMVVAEGDGGSVQIGFGERSSANGDYEQETVMGEGSVFEAEEQHSQDLHFSMEAEKEVSGTQVAVDDANGSASEGPVQKTVVNDNKVPEAISARDGEDTASCRRKRPLRAFPKRLLHGCGYMATATTVRATANPVGSYGEPGNKDDSPRKIRPKRARLVKRPSFYGSYGGTGGDSVA